MARYSLNLLIQLKLQAEKWAKVQGVSLNQFILWAVSEKIGNLDSQLDDPRFPYLARAVIAAHRKINPCNNFYSLFQIT